MVHLIPNLIASVIDEVFLSQPAVRWRRLASGEHLSALAWEKDNQVVGSVASKITDHEYLRSLVVVVVMEADFTVFWKVISIALLTLVIAVDCLVLSAGVVVSAIGICDIFFLVGVAREVVEAGVKENVVKCVSRVFAVEIIRNIDDV